MRKFLLTAAALGAFVATPALADDQWTAVPAKPSTDTGFIGGLIIWDCSASGCESMSDTTATGDLNECAGLAKRVGPLSSFSGNKGPFDAAQLAKCNAAAAK